MAINVWDETILYNENDVIQRKDNNNNIHYFISLQENINKDPLNNKDYWDELYQDNIVYQGKNDQEQDIYIPIENIQTNFSYLDDEDVYDEEQEYNIGDIVEYESKFYRCKQNYTFNILPTNTSYWTEISENIEDNNYNLYDEEEIYFYGDIVKNFDDDSFYRCIENNVQHHPPTDINYWVKCNYNQLESDDNNIVNDDEIDNENIDDNQLETLNNNLINNYLQKSELKYESFLSDWLTEDSSFNDFCNSLLSSSTSNIGKVFLGDFPSSWAFNTEIPREGRAIIEILDKNYIHITLYTNNLQKYEYLFDNTNNSGWF